MYIYEIENVDMIGNPYGHEYLNTIMYAYYYI